MTKRFFYTIIRTRSRLLLDTTNVSLIQTCRTPLHKFLLWLAGGRGVGIDKRTTQSTILTGACGSSRKRVRQDSWCFSSAALAGPPPGVYHHEEGPISSCARSLRLNRHGCYLTRCKRFHSHIAQDRHSKTRLVNWCLRQWDYRNRQLAFRQAHKHLENSFGRSTPSRRRGG